MKKLIKPPLGILKYIFKSNFKNKKNEVLSQLSEREKIIFKSLKKSGYAVIENFISKEKCQDIINIIDGAITNYPNFIWRDKENSDNRILGAEILHDDILNFFTNKMIHRVGETFCKLKLKNTMTMANRVVFKNNNLGSGVGWHRDAYRKQFKSILYLNYVTEDNGPFQLINKSNRFKNILRTSIKLKKNFRNTRYSEEEIKKITSKDQIITLTGSPGSLILFDTTLIHRGKPLNQSTRYALTNYYETSSNFKNAVESIDPHFASQLKLINKSI